jgi:protein N-terminal methyltransferase
VIVVKENLTSSGEVELDEADSSVTRPEADLKAIFEKADLHIWREMQQLKFPKEIYPVKMFALRPKSL